MKHLLVTISFVLHACLLLAAQRVHIWYGTSVSNKSVTLEIFLPKTPSAPDLQALTKPQAAQRTPAVIVCPGGSYCWHDYETEGTQVAQWLADKGIAAFVLNYRVQGIFNYVTHMRLIVPGHHHPQMIQDGQRAIQYVREHAHEFNIDPDKLGVMGFSAGGHLAMSLGEFFHTDFLAPLDIHTQVSLRPDFVAPVYPVVTLSEKICHKRSRRALLGEYRKYRTSMRDSLSLEKHVPADCPPVFLVNCKDDHVVEYHNSELLDAALTAKGVNHRYTQYKTGDHGFGASDVKGTTECRQWRNEFITWLKEIRIL